MKALALIIALALQATGLWQQLPADQRQQLAATATGRPILAVAGGSPSLGRVLPVQVRHATAPPPAAGASSYALDRTSGLMLASSGPTQPRAIASITKIVTSLTILERHQPDARVTIGQLPTYQPDDDLLGLRPGETYTVGELVQAALVPSANDAADALAIYDAGSTTAFAARMNAYVASWGIVGATFAGPSGLKDAGNAVSPEALAKLAGLALAQPVIAGIVRQSSISIQSSTVGRRTLSADTTNQLLASGRYYGIKTGYTLAAGQCFVGLTQIDGHDVITVVLGSTDRFGDTERLVNWITNSYLWF